MTDEARELCSQGDHELGRHTTKDGLQCAHCPFQLSGKSLVRAIRAGHIQLSAVTQAVYASLGVPL